VEARLVEFARLLRQNGVRVSPAETADAARAAALVGVEERAGLRAALRATLVKRAADVPLFDRLFELYFSGLGRLLDGLGRELLADLPEGALEGEDLRDAALALQELAGGLSPLARAAITGERGAVARLFEGAAREVDFAALVTSAQLGFYGRRLFAAAGGPGAAAELAGLEEALRARGLDARALELVSERLRRALDALEQAARRYAELELRARAEARRQRTLAPAGLAALSRGDLARAEEAVRRLAERLKVRLASRARARRGALHLRRTLRRNLGLGGIPARLAFRRRRPERPDVVVLCDVSDSVRHVSRLMLVFVYTLQALFSRVRSFVFVSDVGEVTEAFRREPDVARAADLATAGQVVSLAGNSNYGRALAAFHARHLAAVTRRTTVLVIGDGRTNYHPPQAWVLEELRRRARRLLWICPEERWAWGQGDSEMPLYAAKVERVATVTTLADLEGLAEALLPRSARKH
jgi:uncharacterized protein